MSVQKDRQMTTNYGDPVITGGLEVFDPKFDDIYFYDGDDLGARCSEDRTLFRLWAPTAGEAWVNLYESWNAEQPDKRRMRRDVKGTWVLEAEGNFEGIYYTYSVKIGEEMHEAADPYARAVGVNGDRGCILAPGSTDPQRWTEDRPALASPLDAVIYEIHVRDATIHPASGAVHKGKYLGLAESGTTGPGGIPTGLDHIAGLGVTHVQLLPVYDYATESVDETRLDEPQYNWGYDPKNYNVPEGSYATNPYDPAARIRELKELIQAFHDKGIGVVMDVVYNHVYDGHLIHFTRLVPGYYLRYTADRRFSNGSGCGNDVASERRMVSKFIIDSVLYWAEEFHFDGFRFDLMGLLDIDTMNELRRRLDELDPAIMLYGEGWNIPTELDPKRQAAMVNAKMLPGIGHFSDVIRNAVKGDVFDPKAGGFITADAGYENEIRKGIVGGIRYDAEIRAFAQEPVQSVNYAECHDNYTMWDKIVLATGSDAALLRRAMHRLGSAIIMTSQGIPFLHAGQEFMRTKDGVENSYNADDLTNRLDWDRCNVHQEDVAYMRELIALRRQHPAFRLRTAELIRKHLHFEHSPYHSVAYSLRDHAGGDEDRHLYIIYNSNREPVQVSLPDLGEWEVRFGEPLVRSLKERTMEIDGIGMVVLGIR
ncbi:type I pullulanase [Paenibacillus pinistramenti]|uniref:type I pullulanase n=1 Tax=Paenibacillus pinistramenti TaxID=1768003 RepID=UPI001108CCE6|nr:type I pullulanase [Paenibacillus pinistramenti]